MPPVVTTPRERTLAFAAWIVVCIVWGTTYLAIRVALESVPVALVGGLRFTAAGIILITGLRLTGQPLPSPRSWGAIALSGFLLLVIGNGAVVWAEQYVASGLTAVMVAMVPFWNVVVEAIRPGGERPTMRTLLGLAIGFAGIVVLVWPELFTLHRRQLVRRWCDRLAVGVRRLGGRHIVHQAQHRVAVARRNVSGANARRRSDVPDDRHVTG